MNLPIRMKEHVANLTIEAKKVITNALLARIEGGKCNSNVILREAYQEIAKREGDDTLSTHASKSCFL